MAIDSANAHDRGVVAELGPVEHVGVGEEALLQRDDDLPASAQSTPSTTHELRALEAGAEEVADVLRVREVEGRVDLVEDVHGRRAVLEQGHDQRERDERALAAGELGQALLPDGAEPDADLEALGEVVLVDGDETGKVAGQQIAEDVAKVLADALVDVADLLARFLEQLGDRVLDLDAVLTDGLVVLLERRLALLGTAMSDGPRTASRTSRSCSGPCR